MGGGGGPPRVNVPEQVIQDAFDKGEDFTLESNEQTNLTKDLTIPAEVVFTVKGVLDLGEGNTLTEEGQLIVDGGRIQNEAADVVLSGDSTTIFQNQGELETDGTLTINKDIDFRETLMDLSHEYIKVNSLVLNGDATVTFNSISYQEGAGIINTLILNAKNRTSSEFLGNGIITLKVRDTMEIENGATLKMGNLASLTIGSELEVKGLLELQADNIDSAISGTPDKVTSFRGSINVIEGGSIKGLPNTTDPTNNQKIIIRGGGGVNVFGEDSEGEISSIENCSFVNSEITIGKISDEGIIDGKIYLGEYDTDSGFFSSANQFIDFNSDFELRSKMTVFPNAGLEFVKLRGKRIVPITFYFNNNDDVRFPNGDAKEEFSTFFYKKTENPGFIITTESGVLTKQGSVKRYEDVEDDNHIFIAIDPNE